MAIKEIKRSISSLKNEYWWMGPEGPWGPFTNRTDATRALEHGRNVKQGVYTLLTRVAEVEVT